MYPYHLMDHNATDRSGRYWTIEGYLATAAQLSFTDQMVQDVLHGCQKDIELYLFTQLLEIMRVDC